MDKRTEQIFKDLEPWRWFIDDMEPFGEEPEAVYEDKTNVFVNAPRALIAQGFQSKIDLLHSLYKAGYLLTEEEVDNG